MLSKEEVENLVRAAQKGKNDAFDALVVEFEPAVAGYIFSRIAKQHKADSPSEEKLPPKEEVGELVQQTFVAAFQAVGSFKFESQFGTWLCGIAGYILLHHWRSKAPQSIPETEDKKGETPALFLEPEEEWQHPTTVHRKALLRAAILNLPETYSQPVFMAVYDQLKFSEIARRLNIDEWAVRKRVERGIQMVTEKLGGKQ